MRVMFVLLLLCIRFIVIFYILFTKVFSVIQNTLTVLLTFALSLLTTKIIIPKRIY